MKALRCTKLTCKLRYMKYARRVTYQNVLKNANPTADLLTLAADLSSEF